MALRQLPHAVLHKKHATPEKLASLVQKFDQFRNHLARRFFHQPVSRAFDDDAIDIGCDQLALLDGMPPYGMWEPLFRLTHEWRERAKRGDFGPDEQAKVG